MPSVSSILNIAKEALLTHQASIAVTGHNVANVNTPGYTRQSLDLTTVVPSPDSAGFFGNGVRADSVTRQYDQFMVKRIMDQNARLSNLETLQQSLRTVETIFNEAPGLAVNDLLSQFWESWQELSDNPEISSSRQTVVQQANLLIEQFSSMTSEIIRTKTDIGVSLGVSISEVNALTTQLADVNGQISSSETDRQQQNDLRDRRDEILKDLSGFVDINYFETGNGAYTVMLTDGHTLVENNETWSVEWINNSLLWVNELADGTITRTTLEDNAALGGEIGALVEMNNLLAEGDPENFLGQIDALANSLIREVNQQHTQGVGLVRFSEIVTGAELAVNTTLLQSTVDSSTATSTIEAGTIKINNRSIGRIDGATAVFGLAMAKTYNAVQAINNAYAGANARMTTQVAGVPITGGINGGLDNTESVAFTINGITVNYTATSDETATETATNVSAAINTAITDYNNHVGLTPPQQNIPDMTIEAVAGNGLNGGAVDSIILRNTNVGDESRIIIDGVETDPLGVDFPAENKLGLTNGTYVPDATHNTGEITLYTNDGPMDINGGVDDRFLSELGWGSAISYSDTPVQDNVGGPTVVSFDVNGTNISVPVPGGQLAVVTAQDVVDAINLDTATTGIEAEVGDGTNGGILNSIVFSSNVGNILIENVNDPALLGFNDFIKRSVAAADDASDDGKLTYEFSDNGILSPLMGYDFEDQLVGDGTSFDLWIYNNDGSLALSQPVAVPIERAYNLQDVADAINISIVNTIDDPATTTPWITASVFNNSLVLTPDANHQFAFGDDSSNFLATAGLNTFFSGSSAQDIAVNNAISDDLNKLAAGTINQYGEIFTGDNSNALLITNIQRDETVTFTGGTIDTLDGHYNTLVAEIGLTAKSVDTDLEYNLLISDQLNMMRDGTSGVSLDEEMSNLIKFQHAYSAAAKLITTSDEMLQTLLNSI